jgi:hypothetical protein
MPYMWRGEGSTAIRTRGATIRVLVRGPKTSCYPVAPVGQLLASVRRLQPGQVLRLAASYITVAMAQQVLTDGLADEGTASGSLGVLFGQDADSRGTRGWAKRGAPSGHS